MSRRSPYAAHAAYVALARPATAPALILVGVLAFELTFYALPWVLVLAGAPIDLLQEIFMGRTPLGLFLLLSSFAVPLLALAAVVRRLHHRPARTLLGPPRTAARHFVIVGRLLLLVFLVMAIFTSGFDPDDVANYRPLGIWLLIVPFAALATLIQTGAEEVFYRGYLQQQLGALSSNPLVWMVLPSALFALSHYWNAETLPDRVYYISFTFLLGCIAADITARSGTLGPAIALHMLNNFFELTLFGLQDGPMSGFALVLFEWDGAPISYLVDGYPVANAIYMLLTLMTLLILWLTARLALRR